MNTPAPQPLPLSTAPHSAARRTFGDADGAVIQHAGRYARECVLVAFEMIGGVERLASWADANPTEFFTKMYTKVITRETEHVVGAGVEELLAQLDRPASAPALPERTLEAEYTVEQ